MNQRHLLMSILFLAFLSSTLSNSMNNGMPQKNISQSLTLPEYAQAFGSFCWKYKYPLLAATLGSYALLKTLKIGYPLSLTQEPEKAIKDPAKPTQPFENFWDWKKACDQHCAPYTQANRQELTTPLKPDDLVNEINQFCSSQQKALQNAGKWVGQSWPEIGESFYLQKLDVSTESEVAFHGDLHGDIHSLNAFIEWLAQKDYMDAQNPFKIKKPNFKIMMLGDYTDRGIYGAEVLFTILRLKNRNPDSFFMVRGNHEDLNINQQYGLVAELAAKFKDQSAASLAQQISNIYPLLPVGLYLTCGTENKNALLCCHGGLEIGSTKVPDLLNDARPECYMLLNQLLRKAGKERLHAHYQECFRNIKPQYLQDNDVYDTTDIGYLWNDFNFKSGTTNSWPITANLGGRLEFPEHLTKHILEKDSTPQCKLRGIFRAHQHTGSTMPRILNLDEHGNQTSESGVAKLWPFLGIIPPDGRLWDGIVCTFCVSPNTPYGDAFTYNFDTFGILKTADKFEDWRLTLNRITTKHTAEIQRG